MRVAAEPHCGHCSDRPESRDEGGPARAATATVDLVVPVHNEEHALPGCVRVLHQHLLVWFPFEWSITIVDNASTDRTSWVAHELASAKDRVRVLTVDRKGRGHALRAAWEKTDADVVAYMDVDLSTGLDALFPLVAPLVNRHSDLAIGSRLAAGARTVRGARREVLSRGYNAVLRWSHRARFSDAQCGFKAARTDVVRPLLPHVLDDKWFFDTELLLLAEHNGLRVHEVPVDWVEDVDSRVRVMRTAIDDIAGVFRVARSKVSGAARVPGLPQRAEPRPAHPNHALGHREDGLLWQLLSFGAIGALSTVLTALLYALFRVWWPPLAANLVALVLATLCNTEANRRLTFRRGGGCSGRIHARGLLVFALYYAITSGALLALQAWSADSTRWMEVAVLLASSATGTLVRFVLLKVWVFRNETAKE